MWCSKMAANNTISSIINMWCSELRRNWVGKGGLGMDGVSPTGEFGKMDGWLSRVVGQLFFPRR